MPARRQPSPHVFHEIPNPQVLDAAEQFHDGFLRLIRQPPMSGVLLPALHCAAIAMELYLKSLSALTVEKPDDSFPGAFYIHARSRQQSHKLVELFDCAPPDTQQIIETMFKSRPRLHKFATAREALASYSSMFIDSRYPFEPRANFDQVEFGALEDLLDILKAGIRRVPRRDVPDVSTHL